MSQPTLKVALVHDELVRRGGAEIVFEELIRIFPQAEVYTLYAGNKPIVDVDGKRYHVRTSFLQTLPLWFRRHPSRMLPFLLYAAERFDFSAFDIVISSSSGFAKGIITRASIPHLCYCHTPTRYLWDATHEVTKTYRAPFRFMGKVLLHFLRLADFAAAQRPNVLVANSSYTKERIRRVYRRESDVIYPPIDTAFYTPLPAVAKAMAGAALSGSVGRGTTSAPFVTLGRLTRTKYIEHAIIACEKLGLPLVVIGSGSDEKRLRTFARRHAKFLGKVSQAEVREQLRGARALLQPGIEDFGMAAAEALACGTPVIAFNEGGVKEIVRPTKDGVLYDSQQPEQLAEAIHRFLAIESTFERAALQRQAGQFSRYRFAEGMQRMVMKTLQNHHKSQ